MALPKRRFSRSRRDKRRTQIKLSPQTPGRCSNCGEPVLGHQICSKCGYYKGRQVVTVESEKKIKS